MVARKTDAAVGRKPGPRDLLWRFLRWWQVWLTRLSTRASKALRALRATTRYATGNRLRSVPVVWAGALALLAGATLGVLLSPPGAARSVAVIATALSLVWAPLRLLLMRVSATGALAHDSAAIRGAWGFGSLPWLLGITPELRALAWAASGALTWFALERVGASRRQAQVCVGVTWGAQALVVAGSWLARSALIAILASRG